MLATLVLIRRWVTSPPEITIWKKQNRLAPGRNKGAIMKVLRGYWQVFEARPSRESQQLSPQSHYGLIRHHLNVATETSYQQGRLVPAKIQQRICMILRFGWLEPAKPDKNTLPQPAPSLPLVQRVGFHWLGVYSHIFHIVHLRDTDFSHFSHMRKYFHICENQFFSMVLRRNCCIHKQLGRNTTVFHTIWCEKYFHICENVKNVWIHP